MIRVDLFLCLEVLALGERLLVLADDPRLDRAQLVHEVAHIDNQVPDDREVGERLHDNLARVEAVQERLAGERGRAVDVHPAAAANAHAAGPAERERAVDVVLDVVERVEDHHVLAIGDRVRLSARLRLLLGTVARHGQRDGRLRA